MGRGVPSGGDVLFHFLTGNGAFWCIFGACFNVSIRRGKVKTESKSDFVCPSHGRRIIHAIIHTNTLLHTQGLPFETIDRSIMQIDRLEALGVIDFSIASLPGQLFIKVPKYSTTQSPIQYNYTISRFRFEF